MTDSTDGPDPPEGTGTGLADREGSTLTRSKVTVWSLIALGVVCGVASAVMFAMAYLVWTAPRKKLLELDLERDAAGVLVSRSFPLLVLSVLIFASTSIVPATRKA